MEPTFKTPFIPQQPMQKAPVRPLGVTNRRPRAPIGLGYLVTLIVFLISVIASGGVFFYLGYVNKQIDSLVAEIEKKKDTEPATTAALKRLSNRIESSKVLLKNHVAVSGVLGALERTTLAPVQLTGLSVAPAKGSDAKLMLTIEGQTLDLDAVAFQYVTTRDIDGVSGLVVTEVDNNKPGRTTFTFEGDVNERLVSFEEALAKLSDTSDESMEPPSESFVPDETMNSDQ